MGGELNFRKGYKRGPGFEIQCVREIIASKESEGQEATFERELLKSWSKYPGYEKAKEALSAGIKIQMPSGTRDKRV